MNTKIVGALALALPWGAALAEPVERSKVEAALPQIEAMAAKLVDEGAVPGIAIVVVHADLAQAEAAEIDHLVGVDDDDGDAGHRAVGDELRRHRLELRQGGLDLRPLDGLGAGDARGERQRQGAGDDARFHPVLPTAGAQR